MKPPGPILTGRIQPAPITPAVAGAPAKPERLAAEMADRVKARALIAMGGRRVAETIYGVELCSQVYEPTPEAA